jgi:hypothetical protein
MNSGPETLRAALDRARADLAASHAPHGPPAAAREALSARQPQRPARRWWPVWGGAAFAAAMLGVAILLLLQAAPLEAEADGVGTAFIPVAGAERWPQLVREGHAGPAWVVPAELPRASLAALGLPVDPERAGQTVRAELLVHASGDVLAVRFVR